MKAAFKSMAPDIPSSGQEKFQHKDDLEVSASWSELPSPPSWKICQPVIPIASCPCDSLQRTSSTLHFQAELAEKDKFYSELHSLMQSTPADDKVIILGDFNATVGKDATAWKGVLGRHGVGNCNDNGRLLLELCTEQQLVITNTIFQQKDSLKTTWMHPRSKHWHLIDYVLVCHRDLKDVLHTRVMPSVECHTDHRLVRCKPKLHFKPKQRKGGPPKKTFKTLQTTVS